VTRRYKNTAFLLLGLFVFPIFYQSVHICLHHHRKNEIGCNIQHHDNDNLSHLSFHFSKTIDKDGHCPVCEYQFSVNDLSSVSVFEIGIPKIEVTLNSFVPVQPDRCIVSTKSPRAPPRKRFV
jgi:hypothetical protein